MTATPLTLGPIDGIRPVDGEAALLGRLYIAGVLHHAWFIRVEECDGLQVAVDDPFDRLEDAYHLDPEGAFHTVELPGVNGEFVVLVYPGKR